LINFRILILLLFFTYENFAQESILIPYRAGDKWGYADTLGNIIISPQFEHYDKQTQRVLSSPKKVLKRPTLNSTKPIIEDIPNDSELRGNLIPAEVIYKEQLFADTQKTIFGDYVLYRIRKKITQDSTTQIDKEYISRFDTMSIFKFPNQSYEFHRKNDIDWQYNEWAIVKRDGKYGAFLLKNHLKTVYDSIAQIIIPKECKPIYFVAKTGNHWLIIDRIYKQPLPFKFDNIEFDMYDYFKGGDSNCFFWRDGISVKHKGRWNILISPTQLLSNTGFDKVERWFNGFKVFNNDKIGIYRIGYFFPPKFSLNYTFGEFHSINGFTLMKLYDEQGKFLGFADRKGIQYFSDN